MSVTTKVLSSLVIIPGLGGAGYVAYETLKPYPDYVQKIYKAQDSYGGCVFGLAHNFNSGTGWLPSQAIGSSLDKEDDKKNHKLKKVHEDIEADVQDKIKKECEKRGKGQILELSWQDSAGEFKENRNGTKHILPPPEA